MLTGAKGRPIDDPLLEFVAQFVARELAAAYLLAVGDPRDPAETEHEDVDRRHIRSILHRQAGPVLDRGSDPHLPKLGNS